MWNFIFYALAAKKQKDPSTYFPPLRFLLIPIARYHLFWEYHRRGRRGRSPISPIPRPYSSSSSSYAKEDVIISLSIFCVSAFYVNTKEEEEEEEARGVSAQAPPTKFESRYTEKILIPSHAALTKYLF